MLGGEQLSDPIEAWKAGESVQDIQNRLGDSGTENQKAAETAAESVMFENAADLVATVGNLESKALTFVAMANEGGRVLRTPEIHKLFLGIQGPDAPWLDIGHAVPAQYARTTFTPLGAITKETVMHKGRETEGFQVTEYGNEIGLATAGIMLDLSLKYPDLSLNRILGKTGSRYDLRAPKTRMEILFLLASESRQLRFADIAIALNLDPQTVSTTSTKLQKSKVISIERFERGKNDKELSFDKDRFDLLKSEFKDSRKGNFLTPRLVWNYCKPFVDQGIVVELEDMIEDVLPDVKASSGRDWIVETVRQWERRGVLISASSFSQAKRSKVAIEPGYSEFIADLELAVTALVEGDPGYLDWGKKRAIDILQDKGSVDFLLDKSRLNSPNAQSSSTDDFKESLLAKLSDGQKLTAKELEEIFEAQGKPVSSHSIRNIAGILLKEGKIKVELKSGSKLYYV